MKLVSKFALLVLIVAILYLLLSGNLLSSSPFVIAGQLLAVLLNVWARLSFRKKQFSIHAEPGEGLLLVTGPYQFVRHPMYTAALLLLWTSISGHLSYINAGIGVVVTIVAMIRILTEEKFLNARYPGYRDYSVKTKRIIPFVV